ncbi:hypothetical protein [Helicobacter sp. T3_23-1056]
MTSKKQSPRIHCAILTSFGKKAGGGHLHRAQKIAHILKSYLCEKSKNIDFAILNSEEKGQKNWIFLSEFRAIMAKYAFIIIDSYEMKSRHFKALLKEQKKQKSNKVLILDDGAKFLDFVRERVAKKMRAKSEQKKADFANALRGIYVLNGGLSSENLLKDFTKKLAKKTAKKINNLGAKKTNNLCVKNRASNAMANRLDFEILRDFLKNNVFYGAKFFIKNTDFDFAQKFAQKRLIKPRIKDMLITFGASDSLNYTQKISNMLHRIILQDTKISSIVDSNICLHIVLGGFYPHSFYPKSNMASPKSKQKSSPSSQRIKITHKIYQNLSSKKLARVMRKCDIAISAGGQSLYELAQSTLPFVIIPTASNQLAQSSAFAKKTGAILLKNAPPNTRPNTHNNTKNHKILRQNLATSLCSLSQKKRAKISQNLAKLELGKSSINIARRFLEQDLD